MVSTVYRALIAAPLIALMSSAPASAGFSFTSTKYIDGSAPGWRDYNEARLYSNDDQTIMLRVFGCEFRLLESPTGNQPIDDVVRDLKAKREGHRVGNTVNQGVFELIDGRSYRLGSNRPSGFSCSPVGKGTVLSFIKVDGAKFPAGLIVQQGDADYLSRTAQVMYVFAMKKDYFTPKFKQDTANKAGSLILTLLETWAKSVR